MRDDRQIAYTPLTIIDDRMHSGYVQRANDDEQAGRPSDPLAGLVGEPDPLIRYEALTAAQAAYEDLARRIAAARAQAVSEMHQAGLSYGRIAEVIGFTRSRAQQLVERAEPVKARKGPPMKQGKIQEQLVRFLSEYVKGWPREQPQGYGYRLPTSMADQHTPSDIAELLLAEAGFRAIQFGTWFNSPIGEVVQIAVGSLMPTLWPRDAQLLIEALKIAARLERDRRTRELATALGAAVVVVGLAAAVSRG